MLKSVISFLRPSRFHAVKSFSYFLPAPPKRTSGYQERELDTIIAHLADQDFELLDIKAQSFASETHAGVWVFCRLGALTKEAAKTQINVDYQEIAGTGSSSIQMDPDIVHDR